MHGRVIVVGYVITAGGYKREVMRFIDQETEQYPPFPEHYFNTEVQAVFSAYAEQVKNALKNQQAIPTFLEQNIEDFLIRTENCLYFRIKIVLRKRRVLLSFLINKTHDFTFVFFHQANGIVYSAKAVFNNWLGKVYQITNQDRRLPFMQGINPDNPLDL
jgi:homoserine O-succinyltransferase